MENTAEPEAWRHQLDIGAACEHAGLTDRALEAYGNAIELATTDRQRAQSHIRFANVLRAQSRWDEARTHATGALELARAVDSPEDAAEALNLIAGIHVMRGDHDEAVRWAIEAFAESTSARQRGIALQHQGTVSARRGDLATARRMFEESVAAFREAKYEIGMAYSLINAAMVAQDSGELNRAMDLNDKAIAAARSIVAHDLMVHALQNQAHVMVKLGWFERAQSMLTEAFGFFTTARNPIRQAECLEIMGELNSMRDGDLPTAIRSLTLARELAEKAGDTILTERLSARLRRLAG